MRYVVAIDFKKRNNQIFTFKNHEISDFLNIEKQYVIEHYIKLTTIYYERDPPGLIEANWRNPFFSNEGYFIFLGGFVLLREQFKTENKIFPSPREALEIVLKYKDKHYNVLKGNYYILLLEKTRMQISIYSSPMSMHPAFFSYENDQLIFANYLESFQSYHKISLDNQGLVEFSLFDHSIYDRTVYKEIKLLPGGHRLDVNHISLKLTECYDLSKWHTLSPVSRKKALPKIQQSLQNSINDYISYTNKFNISITGGFDGRLNLSFIPKNEYPRMQAISYGMNDSLQIKIPRRIAKKLKFLYTPVRLNSDFEKQYAELGYRAINITCGITGFNRALYPFAYNIIKNFSRSCLLGQCDMIRPLFKKLAGSIYNDFSRAVFYNDFDIFRKSVLMYAKESYFDSGIYTEQVIKDIYGSIKSRYVDNYKHLNSDIRYYFFLLKESIMKYWHTEFHIVDIYVDDYVSFADLDYLELLFSSEYAGIYKGLFAKSQFKRETPQDLYVHLMKINNNKLNYFFNDRFFMPGWLQFGIFGIIISGIGKKLATIKTKLIGNDTFDMIKWSESFYKKYKEEINRQTGVFNKVRIEKQLNAKNSDLGEDYKFNRAVSLKIWLQNKKII